MNPTVGFVPFSMQTNSSQPSVSQSKRLGLGWHARQELMCIVCYDTEKTATADWHHCYTCTAMWCDACMAAMYETARDHFDDVELSCPQCRGSIPEMQLTTRTRRLTDAAPAGLGCSDAVARELIAYENLLVETVHLCQCEVDGRPHFLLPPACVARVMSRDAVCDIVGEKQGAVSAAKLRRMLRFEDYSGVMDVALDGYTSVLRDGAKVPSVVRFLEWMKKDLLEMAGQGCVRITGLCHSVDHAIEKARLLEAPLLASGFVGSRTRSKRRLGGAEESAKKTKKTRRR